MQIPRDLATEWKYSSPHLSKCCSGAKSVWSLQSVQWWSTEIQSQSWPLIYNVWNVGLLLAPGFRDSMSESHLHTGEYAWFPSQCARGPINLWIHSQWQGRPRCERGEKACWAAFIYSCRSPTWRYGLALPLHIDEILLFWLVSILW